MSFLTNLNDQQKKAVLHASGPAMVLAGAGSGKTRVLTSRAAWLIQNNTIHPENILLVTFTNKAAEEMNNRVQKLTGSRLPYSGTFHSLCARILRQHGTALGIPSSYVIYDADDQLAAVKQVLEILDISNKEFKPRAIRSMISKAKNEMMNVVEYQEIARGRYQETAARVYKKYQQLLQENNALDFDDLLLKTVQLLKGDETTRSFFQDQFFHVLVDEYQDTNKAQYALTRILSNPQHNLFVVGDASQAIYGWRGADYRNLVGLRLDFPDIEEYRLERNYRSTQAILDAASQVISHNTMHPVLELWTDDNTKKDTIVVYEAQNQYDEAEFVINTIQRYHVLVDKSEIAILYRTNAQSRMFEEQLLKAGMPYRIIGGIRFYQRKEIKDILCYLRLVINPEDSVSQQRAVGIGKRRFAAFVEWRETLQGNNISSTPLEIVDQILEATTYKKKYKKTDPEDVARLENIEELRSVAYEFETLEDFLQNVALVDQSAQSHKDLMDVLVNQPEESITLMSMHSAKGLEFEVVFLVGFEDGLFPHSRSVMDKGELEEERRLCYVGITRAKKHLYITHAQSRYSFGSYRRCTPSRFLSEIPSELLDQKSNIQSSNTSRNTSTSHTTKKKPKRRVIVSDDEIDALLNGELDVGEWLEN